MHIGNISDSNILLQILHIAFDSSDMQIYSYVFTIRHRGHKETWPGQRTAARAGSGEWDTL